MASYTFKIQNATYSPEIPITFIQKLKKIPLMMILDTGASHTMIAKRYANSLGVTNIEKGEIWEVSGEIGYSHFVVMQIGTLNPIAASVIFLDNPVADRGSEIAGMLGWKDALSNYSITTTTSTVTFTELPKTVLAAKKIIRRFNNIIVL